MPDADVKIASDGGRAVGAANELTSERLTLGTGALLFLLGLAIGFPLATIGWTFLAENAEFVAALIFALVVLLLLVAGAVVVYRRWIWTRVFQTAEVRLQAFADPLADLAKHAAANQADEAIDAAQILARVALSRWAWISTRRWLIASITGLIAAMAALAGAALLFRQNELIGEQIVRLDQQNELLQVQLELADGQRAASLITELSAIADGIEAATALSTPGALPIVDSADLPASLRARIIAASIAARPYRLLDRASETPLIEGMRSRPELPRLSAEVAKLAPPPAGEARLTERPVSPERGLILLLLQHSLIVKTGALNFSGADFSSAVMTDITLALPDYRHARMERTDFSRSYVEQAAFGGGFLDGVRFRNAVMRNCVFSALPGAEADPPYRKTTEPYPTSLVGAEFSGAFVQSTAFQSSSLQFARFDGAFLHAVNYRNAILAGATFRRAVLLEEDFAGADLRSAEFDGAVVVGADWLARTAAAAMPETFDPKRFTLAPVGEAEVRAIDIVNRHLGVQVPDEALAGKQFFRVTRVGEFE